MKYTNKLLAATTALVVVVGVAEAQSYRSIGDSEQLVKVGQIISTTTLSPTGINTAGDDVKVIVSATAASVSATVRTYDKNGILMDTIDLGSAGVNYATQHVSRTFADPHHIAAIAVSPTGPLTGSQRLYVEIVQPKK